MEIIHSAFDYKETIDRLRRAIAGRGLTLFAEIDHAGAARGAGLEMDDEAVLLFGNPRAGTPLMQSDPRIGIELPLRVLVWSGGDGVVRVGFNDPAMLAGSYDVEPHIATLDAMASLLGALVAEASGS